MQLSRVRALPAATMNARTAAAFSWIPLSWAGVGALVLGALLARWSWIFFAPQPVVAITTPEHEPAVQTGQLFGTAVSAGPTPAAEGVAIPNVGLVGVFAANSGRSGFAILKLENSRQAGILAGKEVVPGTKLLEVHPDYVVLERAGVQQRVQLEGKIAGASAGRSRLQPPAQTPNPAE
ncbi:MAG: type II secretion system protein N [Pseudomonadota bacterium]